MSHVLIHKPLGVTVSDKVIEALYKKHGQYIGVTWRDGNSEDDVWYFPKKVSAMLEMKSSKDIWGKEVESVFVMNSTYSTNGGLVIYENEEKSEYAISVIPSDIAGIEEMGVSHYHGRSKDDVFIKNVLLQGFTETKIKVMKFWAEYFSTSMFLITPDYGLTFFGPPLMEVDGVFYSNLEHEDFLLEPQKTFIVNAILFEFLKKKSDIDFNKEKLSLSKMPHRQLVSRMKEFIPNFSEVVSNIK